MLLNVEPTAFDSNVSTAFVSFLSKITIRNSNLTKMSKYVLTIIKACQNTQQYTNYNFQ